MKNKKKKKKRTTQDSKKNKKRTKRLMSYMNSNPRAYPRKASYHSQNAPQHPPHWSQRPQRWPQRYRSHCHQGYYQSYHHGHRGYYDQTQGPRWAFKEDFLRKEDSNFKGTREDYSTDASGNGSSNDSVSTKGFQVKVNGELVMDDIEAAGQIFDDNRFAACKKLKPPEPQEIVSPSFF